MICIAAMRNLDYLNYSSLLDYTNDPVVAYTKTPITLQISDQGLPVILGSSS